MNRPFFQDAVWLAAIVARAESLEPASPVSVDAVEQVENAATEEELPPELLVDVESPPARERRDRRHRRGRGTETEVATPTNGPSQELPLFAEPASEWHPAGSQRTPIPDLGNLVPPQPPPAFLGRGGFGGRWATRAD